MTKTLLLLINCLALMLVPLSAGAREWSAGLISSPSFIGIQAQATRPDNGETDIFCIAADTYGTVTGRTEDVGIRLSYIHDYALGLLIAENFNMKFHLGAGFMTGFAHDNELGLFMSSDEPLANEMGIIAALSCTIGLRFDFDRPFAIDLGLTANPGVHLRMDRENGSMYLSFYKNGIFGAVLPHISLMYRF